MPEICSPTKVQPAGAVETCGLVVVVFEPSCEADVVGGFRGGAADQAEGVVPMLREQGRELLRRSATLPGEHKGLDRRGALRGCRGTRVVGDLRASAL